MRVSMNIARCPRHYTAAIIVSPGTRVRGHAYAGAKRSPREPEAHAVIQVYTAQGRQVCGMERLDTAHRRTPPKVDRDKRWQTAHTLE